MRTGRALLAELMGLDVEQVAGGIVGARGFASAVRVVVMFLRCKTKSARGVGYWHLSETVRTARGPRQRVAVSLGKLDQAEPAGLRGGWDDLGALLRGETPRAKTADLTGLAPAASPEPSAQWERADISGLRVERTRDFGESYLALSLWHRLKLDELLGTLLPEGARVGGVGAHRRLAHRRKVLRATLRTRGGRALV